MPAETKTDTKVSYQIALSSQEFSENSWFSKPNGDHGFSFYTYQPYSYLRKDTREEALAFAEDYYGPKAGNAPGSYKVREVTDTVTTTTEKEGDDLLSVSKTETHREEVIFTSFRSEEDYKDFYLAPKAKLEADLLILNAKPDQEQTDRKALVAQEEAEIQAEEQAAAPVKNFFKNLLFSK